MGFISNSIWLATGLRHFTAAGYERKARFFDNKVLEQDLKHKVAVITGANAGLGYQTSLELAKRGATVYMVCRNEARGKDALDSICSATNNRNIHLKVCDVSSLQQVKTLGDEFQKTGEAVHILVNNAGILNTEQRQSAEGNELHFATNTLGTYGMTRALLPALRKAAPSRVIFVSSGGMYSEPLVLEDLEGDRLKNADGTFNGLVQYARDKRRMVAMAEWFHRQWTKDGEGVAAYAMHPGWSLTPGVQSSLPGMVSALGGQFRDLRQGADTIVWLAMQDMDKLEGGAFYLDREPQSKHLFTAGTQYGDDRVEQLMAKLGELCKGFLQ